MIWKAILFGFILKNIKNKQLILNDSIPTSSIPKRQRSYSDEFDTMNTTEKEIIINCSRSFFNRHSGYDETYNSSKHPSDEDIIFNITRFNRQMELLKTLENKNMSQSNKVKYIQQYNKDEYPNPIMPNIFSGGLYKDWDFDFK